MRAPLPTTVHQPIETGDDIGLLVRRAKAGDASAFAELYRAHVARVYAYAARRLGSTAAAEEVTQEVFVRALAGLDRCRNEDAFVGCLFAIARHVVAEGHRAHARAAPLAATYDPEDPDPDPEERTLRAEGDAELRAARDRCLSAKERDLFDLLLLDLSDAELALALNRRRGAVRTAQWRLFTKLRACLGGDREKGGRLAHS